MDKIVQARSSRKRALVAAVSVFSAVGAAFAWLPAEAEQTTTPIDIASFGPGPSEWRASDNATIREVASGSRVVGQLQPRSAEGSKTIRMMSVSSDSTIPESGSTIHISARVATGQPRATIVVRAYEASDGQLVARRVAVVRPSSTGWSNVSITLVTSRANSRIRLYAYARHVTGRHTMRMGSISATSTTPGTTPPDPPVPGSCEDIDYSDPRQGHLTFAEEFNGTAIDRTKWRVRDDTFLNQDQAYIRKENVSVHDGQLDIMGKRMAQSDWKTNPNATYTRNQTRDYSTGYVDTIDTGDKANQAGDRFGQKYGHFEVRALVPSTDTMSRGIWPAFWLRADHRLGEIDPLESYGAPTIRSYDPSPSYEWNSWADTSQQSTKDHTQGTAHPQHDNVPIWKDWHTYGVNWSPTCLRYLYDGQTVGLVPLSSKPYFTGYSFDDTFHIRLNLQIGTNYWGWADPAHTRDEFHYRVDWVRVYQGNDN